MAPARVRRSCHRAPERIHATTSRRQLRENNTQLRPLPSTHNAHRVLSPLPRAAMFSPDASFHGVHGPVSRNPRRRQRHDSDSAKNQPDRKRSKISETTLLDPESPAVNGNGSSTSNGHPVSGDEKRRSALRHEIPVREKKQSGAPARSVKGDGSLTLVRSSGY